MPLNVNNTYDVSNFVGSALQNAGREGQVAGTIADSMTRTEDLLIESYSQADGQAGDQWATSNNGGTAISLASFRAKLETQYRKASRAYEAFQNLMKNAHEKLMTAIRNIRLN
jgi:hypothetical protein